MAQNEIYAWIPAYDYDKEWIDDPEPHAIVLVGNGDAGNLLEHEQYHPFANSHGMEFADGGCGSVFYKALFTNFIVLEMDAHPRQVNHTISQLNVPLPQRAPAKLKAPPPSPAKTSPQQLPAPTGPLPLPAPPRYSSRPPPPCDIAHRNPRPRMAVPGGRNGLNDDEEDHAEAFAAASEDDEEAPLPPHLRALADAAQTGNAAALRAALDNYAGSIDDPVEDGDTVLHLACLYGHLPCVQLLLERGASLECKHEEGAIALHEACAGGFTEIVQCILNFAANTAGCASCMLSTVDAEGDTPLHHAARGEHMDTVKLLLEAGACPKKENSYGQAPAEMADQDTEVRALLTAKQVEASVHMGN